MDTLNTLPAPLRYAFAFGICLIATIITLPLREQMELANAVMLFLLAVFITALYLGRGPAILAVILSVILFDFFMIPPHFSLAVSDPYNLITFAVMLAVGLFTSNLTVNVQEEAARAKQHERQTRDLYELARNLTGATTLEQVEELIAACLQQSDCESSLFLFNDSQQLKTLNCSPLELQLLNLAFHRGEPVMGEAEESGPELYLPLQAPMRTRGVLLIRPTGKGNTVTVNAREHFLTMASLVAIAIERLHYVDVAQETQLQISAEKMRSSILSTLSHDLRTPLTSLVGLADALAQSNQMPHALRDDAKTIRDQSRAISNLLTNLLEMARLQSGKVKLRREWQLLEEVVSASLQLLRPYLGNRPVLVTQDKDMPLLEFDAVLLERVVCNLIENAAKYSGEDQPIEIHSSLTQQEARISICDCGPGFPPGRNDQLFELFERGETESAKPGAGLGLAICKTIMEAHGGRIEATNRDAGGACVTLYLPLGSPPAFEEEAEHV